MRQNTNIPFNPSKSPFFYGWVIVFAGTVGILFSIPGQTMGVSVFTDHLIESLNISRDALSTAYLLGTISSSLILTYAGKLYDKLGARIVAIAAALFLSVSLVLASYSPDVSFAIAKFSHAPFATVSFILIALVFFFIRFSGQGVLTLASRNMIMKWFDQKRGRANAFSSVFSSMGFAISPLIFSVLISTYTWRTTWRIIAVCMVLFAVFAFMLFRDNPEECGLTPDGAPLKGSKGKIQARKQFTLKEATRTWAFWIFTLALSFYSFFNTGFTFNVISIFKSLGYTEAKAVGIFIPISIVSVLTSIIGNYISDFTKLQYMLWSLLASALLSTISVIFLNELWGYYLLIASFGLMGGLFIVLVSVTWPRFFGRAHLGAISGLSSSALVFSSAIGPLFFSRIFTVTNSYKIAGIIGSIMVVFLLATAFKAKNPQ